MNSSQCIGELNEGMGFLELEWDICMNSVEYLDLKPQVILNSIVRSSPSFQVVWLLILKEFEIK